MTNIRITDFREVMLRDLADLNSALCFRGALSLSEAKTFRFAVLLLLWAEGHGPDAVHDHAGVAQ